MLAYRLPPPPLPTQHLRGHGLRRNLSIPVHTSRNTPPLYLTAAKPSARLHSVMHPVAPMYKKAAVNRACTLPISLWLQLGYALCLRSMSVWGTPSCNRWHSATRPICTSANRQVEIAQKQSGTSPESIRLTNVALVSFFSLIALIFRGSCCGRSGRRLRC